MPRAAWDDWRDIRTIPPRTTVEVRTVTGLIRRARLAYPDTEPRYERRTKSIACWGIGWFWRSQGRDVAPAAG